MSTAPRYRLVLRIVAGFLSFVIVLVSAEGLFNTRTVPRVEAIDAEVTSVGPFTGFEVGYSIIHGAAAQGATAVSTGGSFSIENVLNGIAWAVAKAAIQSITRSLVTWINSGFQGSPAFVTDLNATMLSLSDHLAGNFISQIVGTDFICSPFRIQLATALRNQYFNNSPFFMNACTLTGIENNVQNALNNVGFGGWSSWLTMTTQPQNNFYGAYFQASAALGVQLTNAQGRQLTLLGWGKGFLSWCGSGTKQTSAETVNLGSDEEAGKDLNSVGVLASKPNNSQNCLNEDGSPGVIETPGSVIESQLENQLGSGVRQLEIADSINEIVGALMQQLVTQALGATGLFGLSQPAPGGGPSYLDQGTTTLQNPSAGGDLANVVSHDVDTMNQYKANWQTIQTAATGASAALTSLANACPDDAAAANSALTGKVAPVLAESVTEIGRADTSLATLATVKTEASTANSIDTLQKAAADYQAFTTATTTPSAQEVGDAILEASDSGDATPPSRFTEMTELTQKATDAQPLCSPFTAD